MIKTSFRWTFCLAEAFAFCFTDGWLRASTGIVSCELLAGRVIG